MSKHQHDENSAEFWEYFKSVISWVKAAFPTYRDKLMERHLNIRAFSSKMARTAYERQKGICPKCKEHFDIEEMQADHITPWSKGGRTSADNCQMLCADCNRRKSDM